MFAKIAAAAAAVLLPCAADAAPAVHYPVEGALAPGAVVSGGPAFSGAVMTGNTLYVAGMTDSDPVTNVISPDPKVAARIVLTKIQNQIQKAGLTMDDLVWVQIFAADLQDYAAFNEVYRSFFKGRFPPAPSWVPMPCSARRISRSWASQ
ncbi:MAG TPA: RidA family protein [Rhizomicrobium sp.]|nr:RidA family protein [Rhizomicrobium sp.]